MGMGIGRELHRPEEMIAAKYNGVEVWSKSPWDSRIRDRRIIRAIDVANDPAKRQEALLEVHSALPCDSIHSVPDMEFDVNEIVIGPKKTSKIRIKFRTLQDPVKLVGFRSMRGGETIQKSLYQQDLAEGKKLPSDARLTEFDIEKVPLGQRYVAYALFKEVLKSHTNGPCVLAAVSTSGKRIVTGPLYQGASTQASSLSFRRGADLGRNDDTARERPTEDVPSEPATVPAEWMAQPTSYNQGTSEGGQQFLNTSNIGREQFNNFGKDQNINAGSGTQNINTGQGNQNTGSGAQYNAEGNIYSGINISGGKVLMGDPHIILPARPYHSAGKKIPQSKTIKTSHTQRRGTDSRPSRINQEESMGPIQEAHHRPDSERSWGTITSSDYNLRDDRYPDSSRGYSAITAPPAPLADSQRGVSGNALALATARYGGYNTTPAPPTSYAVPLSYDAIPDPTALPTTTRGHDVPTARQAAPPASQPSWMNDDPQQIYDESYPEATSGLATAPSATRPTDAYDIGTLESALPSTEEANRERSQHIASTSERDNFEDPYSEKKAEINEAKNKYKSLQAEAKNISRLRHPLDKKAAEAEAEKARQRYKDLKKAEATHSNPAPSESTQQIGDVETKIYYDQASRREYLYDNGKAKWLDELPEEERYSFIDLRDADDVLGIIPPGVGKTFSAEEARKNSPRFKAAFQPVSNDWDPEGRDWKDCFVLAKDDDSIWNYWIDKFPRGVPGEEQSYLMVPSSHGSGWEEREIISGLSDPHGIRFQRKALDPRAPEPDSKWRFSEDGSRYAQPAPPRDSPSWRNLNPVLPDVEEEEENFSDTSADLDLSKIVAAARRNKEFALRQLAKQEKDRGA